MEFIVILCILPIIVIIISSIKPHRQWESIATMEEYLIQHPECKTQRGIQCAKCHSSSIRNWGLCENNNAERCCICNHCGKSLYRSA